MSQDAAAPTTRPKLSIYPAAQTDILLLDTPSALETHIGTARRAVTGTYRDAHAHLQGVVSRWIGVENRVEARLKSLLPPDERLLPGALYAAIALLATSILTRHRALPLRAALPPLAGAAAFAYYLPHLSANIRAYAGALEDAHLPALAHVHETGKAHSAGAWARLTEQGAETREKARVGVVRAVEGLQRATGLRVGEALGVAREVEERVEKVVQKVVHEVVEDLKAEKKKDD
ncbi:apolipo protein O-domain-containing protein [Mycena olivaceomarginata]|nr:apolipo protein O-domain-containing protein [Mycena olivaceomarginata]